MESLEVEAAITFLLLPLDSISGADHLLFLLIKFKGITAAAAKIYGTWRRAARCYHGVLVRTRARALKHRTYANTHALAHIHTSTTKEQETQ